jgi:hypothetical protein
MEQQSTLKKIEFGFLEMLVGAMMVIGLIGYFGNVGSDMDWLDHTISFLLFTYLFYKLNITSILFGHSRRGLNALIVVSFFLLFFKDIISYTLAAPNDFRWLTFVPAVQQFFSENLGVMTNATFYIGLGGVAVASILYALSAEIAHPSLGYALFPQVKERKSLTVGICFVLLIAFYYFVYNAILEWLEFVLDDPIIATGIVFYIHSLTTRKEQFHSESFVFRIGEFSESLYTRFVSLFHYKKTLPLGISGLLILHALADLGVFAYSFSFARENLYLESLQGEHSSWWELFGKDGKSAPLGVAFGLAIVYALNALSMAIFLLIPIIVWWRIFTQKDLHLNRGALFLMYAAGAAFFLLPAYDVGPLDEEKRIVGVDIFTFSVMDSPSPLERLLPERTMLIVVVAVLSLLLGVLAMLLAINARGRKELYAFAIACSLLFFGFYLYEFMGSVLLYLGESAAQLFAAQAWVLAVLFGMLFILSILFYIVGYFLFLYEVIMEYHNQKWSEPVDEELIRIINFMRRTEQRLEHRGRPGMPAPQPFPRQPSFRR